MATTKAVIYPRVSTAKQEDGVSLSDQERHCRTYCAGKGYEVVAVIPETYSGYDSLDVRPGLRQVRDMVRRKEAEVIVVWRYDRATRDITDSLLLHREVTEAGGRLESATEGLIEDSPLGRVMLALTNFAGESERDVFKKRSQSALRTRAESGKLYVGRSPKLGYHYVGQHKDTYAIDNEGADIVRHIFDMAYNGMALRAITTKLNEEGIPTATQLLQQRGYPGKKVATKWGRQMVFQLLRDPAYMGQHVVYRKQQVKRRVQDEHGHVHERKVMKLRAADDTKRIVQAIPAIVTPEVWEAVQRNLKERALQSTRSSKVPDNTLLKGFVFCGHCGSRMVTSVHQKGYRNYRCSNRKQALNTGKPPCTGGGFGVKAPYVDDDVWAKAIEMGGDIVHMRRMLDARQEKIQRHQDNDERDAATIDAEIADCKQKQDRLARRMGTEDDDNVYAVLRQEATRVRDTLQQLEARKARLPERQQHYTAWLAEIEEVSKLIDKATEMRQAGPVYVAFSLEDLSKEDKRKVLRALGVRVFVYNTTSEYAKTHDTRWEFTVVAPDTGRLGEPKLSVTLTSGELHYSPKAVAHLHT